MKKRIQDIDELLPRLLMLKRLMHTRFTRASGKFDPHGWVRMETLRFINDAKNPSMQDVARHLSITAASATSLVGTLAKAKLVERRAGKEDKRVVLVALTSAGSKELARSKRLGEKVITGIFSKLTGEDIRLLTAIFGRLEAIHEAK